MTSDTHPTEAIGQSRQFQCPQCGGKQSFDPVTSQLTCESCRYAEVFDDKDAQDSIVEYDLLEGLSTNPEQGLGLSVRTFSCQGCGAIVSFGINETAGSCSFCASSQVLELDSHRQTIRPESLVPFGTTQSRASESFKVWIRSLWFRPNDLKKLAAISKIQGLYIPYWVFDATVESDWKALAGHYYYTSESYTTNVGGRSETRTRRVRHTRWVPARGQRRDVFDDFLICASTGLPKNLVDKLDTFETKSLVRYDPSYIAGWKAEEYQLELKPAWTDAVHRMEEIQSSRCSSDVPGDTQRGLQVHNVFSETRFKHVLLPIWIAAYRYREKTYQFLVNGQTGEVEGHAPYSVWKITFAVLLVLLGIGVIFVLSAASQQ